MIARGKGMTERSMERSRRDQDDCRCLYPPGRLCEPDGGDRQSQGPSGFRNHQRCRVRTDQDPRLELTHPPMWQLETLAGAQNSGSVSEEEARKVCR